MNMSMQRVLNNPITEFCDYNLRGIGQVMLLNNPWTGLLFLVGIFINSWHAGLYALLGTIVATGSALLLGAPRRNVSDGLYGLNGTLTGLGLAFFLDHDVTLLL